MKKLFVYIIVALSIASCQKHSSTHTYEDIFQIRFKLDGKEYSKVLKQNELNSVGSVIMPSLPGQTTLTQGPTFELGGDYWEIEFLLGYLHNISGDKTGNLQKIRNLLRTGSKQYKCLWCDTSITDAIEIALIESGTGSKWCTTQIDQTTHKPKPVNEQNGSSFVVTEVKESTIDDRAAFIVKGSFNCNLFSWQTGQTGMKKVLTDGEFTFIMGTISL